MVDRVQTSEINKQCRYKWCSAKQLISLFKVSKSSESKVTGGRTKWLVLVTVCVCVWGGESEFNGAWDKREGGRETGQSSASWQPDEWSCPSVCWSWPGDSAVYSLMAADWRSYVTGGWDHLQCRGLCGWDGCCRCPGGRGERHQQSSQLLSLSVEGTCCRTRCRRHTTQWCS